MSKKLSDNELKELFIKVVRPFEEEIKTKQKEVIHYRNRHQKEISKLVHLEPVNQKKVENGISRPSSNNHIIFYKYENEGTLFSLIRHLRNSIAHCFIKLDVNTSSYLFEDIATKKKIYTMSGKIEVDKLNKLIDYIHIESRKFTSTKKSEKKKKKSDFSKTADNQKK